MFADLFESLFTYISDLVEMLWTAAVALVHDALSWAADAAATVWEWAVEHVQSLPVVGDLATEMSERPWEDALAYVDWAAGVVPIYPIVALWVSGALVVATIRLVRWVLAAFPTLNF